MIGSATVAVWRETNGLAGLQKSVTACSDGTQVPPDEKAAEQAAETQGGFDVANGAFDAADPVGKLFMVLAAYESAGEEARAAYAQVDAMAAETWATVATTYNGAWDSWYQLAAFLIDVLGGGGPQEWQNVYGAALETWNQAWGLAPAAIDDEVSGCLERFCY